MVSDDVLEEVRLYKLFNKIGYYDEGTEKVLSLLRLPDDINCICPISGRSLLQVAISSKNQKLIDYLLQTQEIDLGFVDEKGKRAEEIAFSVGSNFLGQKIRRLRTDRSASNAATDSPEAPNAN